MRSPEVLCSAAADYEQSSVNRAVERIFRSCRACERLGASSRVLLKPNLLAKHTPEQAVTTHPAVIAAVCEALHARGVCDITLADSPGGPYNPITVKGIYKAGGILDVCSRYGVKAYTQCESAPRASDGVRVREFQLICPVHEADFIIDLPKIKTHVMTGMTCAVKNLFGTVPGLQKAEFHMRFPEKEPFGEMLVDLCETVRPDLVIADGIEAMEGDGPAGGEMRPLGVVLGGEDPYSLDLAVCRIMGIDAMQVPYLAAANRRGLCAERFDAALLRGDVHAADPVPGYRLPQSYADIGFADKTPRAIRWIVPGVEKWIAPRPKIDRRKCIGCGKCAEICPGHTITVQNKKAHIDPKNCIRCFCCHEMCPVKAIDVKRFGLFNL